MRYVLTLIGDPVTSGLEESTAETARAALAATGGEAGAADWLAPGIACDIPFDGAVPEEAAAAVRRRLGEAPIDIAAQPLAGRRKVLLVADMESTIIGQEMIDVLAEMGSTGP